VVPGSHKANFAPPKSLLRYEAHRQSVRQVACKAGSAVIFTEALTHGTLPWTGERQRRTLLTRYTRGNMSYLRPRPTPAWATGERERVLFEPPYQQKRFGRPELPE
jgi:ectoine hydroxylase-related dioxygenase (phytanoyl-CoA dioxygenase family)